MKKITIILFVFAAFAISGCSDFLEKAPLTSQSTDLTLSSYAGLNKSVAGAYSPLQSTSWYGASFVLDCEMRSGNGSREADGKFQSGRYSGSYTWNYSADNTSGFWSWGYFVISAVNNVLANLDGKDKSGVTAQDLNNLKGECLFLRALSHLDLALLYAQPYTYKPEGLGVPVVLITDPLGKPARETLEKTYGQIVQDLLDAEAAIADNYARAGITDAKAAATKPAIQALLSRVYLYMGKWQEAANYATKVIGNPAFNLWSATDYPSVWNKEKADATGEVIFEVYGKKTNAYHGSWEDISYVTNPDGYADVRASQDLLDLFEKDDVRGSMFRTDKNKESGLMWSTKYTGKGDGTPDANNIIVLRLSEMYLNRAEALVNGATISGVTAISDLNAIRTRRGLEGLNSAGRGDVEKERRLELAFEGHYLFDLARWGQSVTRTDFTGNVNQNVEFPSYRWAIPIPKREFEVNENLIQNEGYEK